MSRYHSTRTRIFGPILRRATPKIPNSTPENRPDLIPFATPQIALSSPSSCLQLVSSTVSSPLIKQSKSSFSPSFCFRGPAPNGDKTNFQPSGDRHFGLVESRGKQRSALIFPSPRSIHQPSSALAAKISPCIYRWYRRPQHKLYE